MPSYPYRGRTGEIHFEVPGLRIVRPNSTYRYDDTKPISIYLGPELGDGFVKSLTPAEAEAAADGLRAASRKAEPHTDPPHCCQPMADEATRKCPTHPADTHCPDRLITYNQRRRTYGLPIHDGGTSHIHISYCPWCGLRLAGDT